MDEFKALTQADLTIDTNTCDFTVKEGTRGASFTEPWSEGTAQIHGAENVRSAAAAAKVGQCRLTPG